MKIAWHWQMFWWLTLMAHQGFAADLSITVGAITLQQHERPSAQSDKLLIKAAKQSFALDLDRSVGLSGIASMTSDGLLLAGPYVFDTRDGKLVRQSPAGYRALSPSIDIRANDNVVEWRNGAHHYHCKLPSPVNGPFSVAPSIASDADNQTLLVFTRQQNHDSGITSVKPIVLGILGCKLRQPREALASDHAMLIPQASRGTWWTYSVSEPLLAVTTNGIDWRYSELPPRIRSLLSAFVEDSGTTWIAAAITDNDDATVLFKQAVNTTSWHQVPVADMHMLPPPWIEGRFLLLPDDPPSDRR